ncbi:MAG: Mur ligase domain-containing protein, partial [Fusobacteria bacterium]|nr:Mur ligase domain-containing protein [Fusobacteriota bacterium]
MKIYFIGVNGIGVSGLAKISKFLGHDVYGSDQSRTPMSETLEAQGIKFYDSHDSSRIKDMDVIVYSTAVKLSNPELVAAIKLKKLIFKRGEYLAKLMHFQEGVAVAGAHGKTTTTSMCATIFLPSDATFYIGGVLPEVNDTVHPGTSSVFISEADESDNSFLYMRPKYSIITNIEPDHIDFHGSFDHIKDSFDQFMQQTTNQIVACGECENLKTMVSKYPEKARIYGFNSKYD